MTISQTTNKWLNRPDNPERTSLDAEAYMRARNQSLAHQMILAEFKRSGISQTELAKRTGKGTDVISRLIGRPGNWTLNTLSDLLFAMSAAAPSYSLCFPLSVAPVNQNRPTWADQDLKKLEKTTETNNPLPKPAKITWENVDASL
jgi:hypothetical protein